MGEFIGEGRMKAIKKIRNRMALGLVVCGAAVGLATTASAQHHGYGNHGYGNHGYGYQNSSLKNASWKLRSLVSNLSRELSRPTTYYAYNLPQAQNSVRQLLHSVNHFDQIVQANRRGPRFHQAYQSLNGSYNQMLYSVQNLGSNQYAVQKYLWDIKSAEI